MITLERLKYLLSYDPETGLWTRLVTRPGRNAKAGSIARHIDGDGYVQIHVDGRYYRSTRLAFFYMTGEQLPDDVEVDHKDRDRSNDRWNNLRLATDSQNKANGDAYETNQLKVRGVGRGDRQRSKPFRARIQVDGKPKHLGYFETPELASAAYKAAAIRYFGEFAGV